MRISEALSIEKKQVNKLKKKGDIIKVTGKGDKTIQMTNSNTKRSCTNDK